MNEVLKLATDAPPVPSKPFRGIDAFQYGDRGIFFLRDREAQRLLRYITVYRCVLLYGESGVGKSSLVNAGLLPEAVLEGFRPERVRVQPRSDEEIVIERISVSPDSLTPLLPSLFSSCVDSAERVVLSVSSFEAELRKRTVGPNGHRTLLVFDQFEELVTLFEEARPRSQRDAALDQQREIVDMLARLLRDETLAVKLLFSFREDFLGQIRSLFEMQPDMMDHYLRLHEPSEHAQESSGNAVKAIIRSPFEHFPGRYQQEISADLAEAISVAVEERNQHGSISLSEIQIVCLRLWESEDAASLFAKRGLEGIIVDYLHDSLAVLKKDHQEAAIALLGFLVTPSGARNIISEEDLLDRAKNEAEVNRDVATVILKTLESRTRLVRRELRRGLYFYEITSEFLAPWIMVQRERRKAALRFAREFLESAAEEEKHERAAELRWRRFGWLVSLLTALVAFGLATVLAKFRPSLGLTGWQGAFAIAITFVAVYAIGVFLMYRIQMRVRAHSNAAAAARRMQSRKQLRTFIGEMADTPITTTTSLLHLRSSASRNITRF